MSIQLTNYKSVTNCNRYAIEVNGDKCIPNIVAYGMQCTFYYEHKEKRINFKWLLWNVENPTNEELENVKRHAKSLFKDKEREKCMITDEQGREWLLTKFYEFGCNKIDTRTATARFVNIDGANSITLGHVPNAILGIKYGNEFIDIAEELGIVDWSKVEVDTPIFVRNSTEEVWKCRYFAMYEDGEVYAWQLGRTSWSNLIKNLPIAWKYAKLAGDTHE